MSAIGCLSEKTVQTLIADYPWLLNLDYETVFGLKNKGMEVLVSDQKRIDLILRDRKTGRPVLIEFKAVPFYRENIGQILEYRARVIQEMTKEGSYLYDIFEDKLLAPILILVVPTCSPESRLACNLAGIDVYEYDKLEKAFTNPEYHRSLREFANKMEINDMPLVEGRSDLVIETYRQIHELMYELDCSDGYKVFRKPSGEYYIPMTQVFINKHLFSDNPISIGIYENIYSEIFDDKIIIEFYSKQKSVLLEFISRYSEKSLVQVESELIAIENEYYWSEEVDKKFFINNTQEILRPKLVKYLEIISSYNI